MKASNIVSAATAAMLLCGISASRAGDAPAPAASPSATPNAAASPSQSAPASQASSGVSASATRTSKDGHDPACLKSTGSRIPPTPPSKCLNMQPGHVWSGKDVKRTGGTDTATSLQYIGDPTLVINHH
jgi:hypothetical protein